MFIVSVILAFVALSVALGAIGMLWGCIQQIEGLEDRVGSLSTMLTDLEKECLSSIVDLKQNLDTTSEGHIERDTLILNRLIELEGKVSAITGEDNLAKRLADIESAIADTDRQIDDSDMFIRGEIKDLAAEITKYVKKEEFYQEFRSAILRDLEDVQCNSPRVGFLKVDADETTPLDYTNVVCDFSCPECEQQTTAEVRINKNDERQEQRLAQCARFKTLRETMSQAEAAKEMGIAASTASRYERYNTTGEWK